MKIKNKTTYNINSDDHIRNIFDGNRYVELGIIDEVERVKSATIQIGKYDDQHLKIGFLIMMTLKLNMKRAQRFSMFLRKRSGKTRYIWNIPARQKFLISKEFRTFMNSTAVRNPAGCIR